MKIKNGNGSLVRGRFVISIAVVVIGTVLTFLFTRDNLLDAKIDKVKDEQTILIKNVEKIKTDVGWIRDGQKEMIADMKDIVSDIRSRRRRRNNND